MRKNILLLMLVFSSITSFAEKNDEEKKQDMFEEKVAYIVDKMELTKEETENFIPIYKKYLTERFDTHESSPFENFEIKAKSNLSEEEFKKLNDAFVNARINRALSTKLYYEKFREVIPDSKIYKMQMAERDFKLELLKKVQNKGCNTKKTTNSK